MEPLEYLIKIRTTPEILNSLLDRAIAELTDSVVATERSGGEVDGND